MVWGGICLQVWVLLVWQGHGRCVLHFLLVLLHCGLVDLDFWWGERWGGDEFLRAVLVLWPVFRCRLNTYERLVAHKLPRKPQERLLEVVVGLGGDFEVLDVLLAVEGNSSSLHFSLLQCAKKQDDENQHIVKELVFRLHTLTSTLLPQRTMGMLSQTRSRSRCQLGTFL